MALTPTSTIVHGPQVTADRFNFQPFSQNTLFPGARPAMFLNSMDQYVVLFENSNFGAGSSSLVYKLAVFKNGTQQDAANKPTIRNWDNGGILNCNSGFDVIQVGTDLYVFYFTDGSGASDSLLAFKIFHMATNLWGAPNVSTLPTKTVAVAGDPYNQFTNAAPYFTVTYDTTNQYFYIIAATGIKVGTNFVRPAFTRFLGGSSTWDNTWTTLGDLTTQENQAAFSSCIDCRGAVNLVIASTDQSASPKVTTLYLQTIYSDQTVSILQATGAVATNTSISIMETDSRILCTGTELIVIWGSADDGFGFWRQTNCARATIPASNILPASWTLQVVRASSNDWRVSYVPFFINKELYVVESLYNGGSGSVTASHWNGATWDNDITFSPVISLALVNGDLPGRSPIITFNLGAPTDTVGDLVAPTQHIYGLISYDSPVCPAQITGAESLGFLDTNSAAIVPGPGPNPPPQPGTPPIECPLN